MQVNWKLLYKIFVIAIIILSTIYFFFRLYFERSDVKLLNMSQVKNIECSENISYENCQDSLLDILPNIQEKKFSTLRVAIPHTEITNKEINLTQVIDIDFTRKKTYQYSAYISLENLNTRKKNEYCDVSIYIDNTFQHIIPLANFNHPIYFKIYPIKPNHDSIKITYSIKNNINPNHDTRLSIKFASLRNYQMADGDTDRVKINMDKYLDETNTSKRTLARKEDWKENEPLFDLAQTGLGFMVQNYNNILILNKTLPHKNFRDQNTTNLSSYFTSNELCHSWVFTHDHGPQVSSENSLKKLGISFPESFLLVKRIEPNLLLWKRKSCTTSPTKE